MTEHKKVVVDSHKNLQFRIARHVEDGCYVVLLGDRAWVYDKAEDAIENFMALGSASAGVISGETESVNIAVTPIINNLTGAKGVGMHLLHDINRIIAVLAGLDIETFERLCPLKPEMERLH